MTSAQSNECPKNLAIGYIAATRLIATPRGCECVRLPCALGSPFCAVSVASRRRRRRQAPRVEESVMQGLGSCPPLKVSIPQDESESTRGSFGPTRCIPLTASRSVHPFLHSSSPVCPTHRHTDTQTTLHATSVASGRICAMRTGDVANKAIVDIIVQIRGDSPGQHRTGGDLMTTIAEDVLKFEVDAGV